MSSRRRGKSKGLEIDQEEGEVDDKVERLKESVAIENGKSKCCNGMLTSGGGLSNSEQSTLKL